MAAAEAEGRRWLLAAGACPLVLAAFAAVAPYGPADAPYVAGVVAFGLVSAEVLTVSALTPTFSPRVLVWLGAPLSALAVVGLAGSGLPTVTAAAIVTGALLLLGTMTGGVVGSAIEVPGHLLVVAVVSALVDTFSVLHPSGPTAQLVEIDAAVDVLLLPWPMLGTGDIQPVLGVGDIAFAAIYTAASRRHGLPMWRTVAALGCGLAVTLAVVIATGRGTPALPFLGAAVVIAQPRARRLPKPDRNRALGGLVALALLFTALFLWR